MHYIWLRQSLVVTEFKHTWLGLANSKEQYVLKYESKYLRELGKSLDYVLSFALGTAAQELLKYTVLSSKYGIQLVYFFIFPEIVYN